MSPMSGHLGAQDLLVSPPMTWAKAATEPSRAMVRGSPKRSPGARWPSWTLGSTIDSRVAGSGSAGRPSPRAARNRALVSAPARRNAFQLSALSVLCTSKSLALFTVVSTRRARPSFR